MAHRNQLCDLIKKTKTKDEYTLPEISVLYIHIKTVLFTKKYIKQFNSIFLPTSLSRMSQLFLKMLADCSTHRLVVKRLIGDLDYP